MAQNDGMKPIPLSEFVAQSGGQINAGKLLSIAQPTISLMLKRDRQIFVIADPVGGWTYYEIKAKVKAA